MSGLLSGVGVVGGALQSSFGAISSGLSSAFPGLSGVLAFIRQPRSVGTIIPDVTIEEHFTDRVQVTQHPTAQSTPMSDHAFLLPRLVVMKLGFTNSNPVGASVGNFVSSLTSGASVGDALSSAGSGLLSSITEQRAKQVYDKFLALQFNDKSQSHVVPFSLTAGKRSYKNMVITDLVVTNTAATEYALIIEVHMQQVMIVDTSASPTASSAPQTTNSPTNTGNQSATQTDNPAVSGSDRPELKTLLGGGQPPTISAPN